jgi:hypothetical protein
MALPKSGTVVKLTATVSGEHVDIIEQQLAEYIVRYEDEELGRHPPTAVCRELLTETRHHCTKCTKGIIDHKMQLIYKDKLNKPIDDPDQALKIARDKKVIKEIFGDFPSTFIEIFLEEAKSDKLWYDLPIHLDGLKIRVNSPMFYLYDDKLWQLLKDFFT